MPIGTPVKKHGPLTHPHRGAFAASLGRQGRTRPCPGRCMHRPVGPCMQGPGGRTCAAPIRRVRRMNSRDCQSGQRLLGRAPRAGRALSVSLRDVDELLRRWALALMVWRRRWWRSRATASCATSCRASCSRWDCRARGRVPQVGFWVSRGRAGSRRIEEELVVEGLLGDLAGMVDKPLT
jgi:hypothetical protein